MAIINEFSTVLIAVPNQELARTIATALLENNLAASVQILGPMESHYWWQGEIQHADEYLCLCKAKSQSYPELESRVRALHPYATPEIIAVPISAGSPDYLAWLSRYASSPD